MVDYYYYYYYSKCCLIESATHACVYCTLYISSRETTELIALVTSSNFLLMVLKNKASTGTKIAGQELKQLSSLLRHDSLLSISEEGKGVNVFQSALPQQLHAIIFVPIDKLVWCLTCL